MTYEEFVDALIGGGVQPAGPITLRGCMLHGAKADYGMHLGLGAGDVLESVLLNLDDHVVAEYPEHSRRLVRNCCELLNVEIFGFDEFIALHLIASNAFDQSCALLMIQAIDKELQDDGMMMYLMLRVIGSLCEWVGNKWEPAAHADEDSDPVVHDAVRALLWGFREMLSKPNPGAG